MRPEKSWAVRVISLAASPILVVRAPAVPRRRSSSALPLSSMARRSFLALLERHFQHAGGGGDRCADRGTLFGKRAVQLLLGRA